MIQSRTIDITTTATLRPELLDETLRSFKEHLFHDWAGYRLIINVDKIGDDVPADAVLAVARKHFSNVVHRVSDRPNFAVAQRWCWSQVASDYFFNLEDDWQMQYPLDLIDMVRLMEKYPSLALLRLNKFEAREATCRQWNRHIPWNGEFFELPHEHKSKLGYSGNPSLIRTFFVAPILDTIRDNWCPEKTLKGYTPFMKRYLEAWRFGIYAPQNSQRSVLDIGRTWRSKHRWYKHRGYSFTTWQPLPEGHDEKSYAAYLRQKGSD